MYNKFTLILDGKFTLNLTRKNYAQILANWSLVGAVTNMLADMDAQKVYGMGSNTSGWMIQINLKK
jgi:hypothetical protein